MKKRPHTEVEVLSFPKCDMCQEAPARYDAKTIHGPWAYLCLACWPKHTNMKLGLGLGQRLVLRSPDELTESASGTE